jgi:hypothetical protein
MTYDQIRSLIYLKTKTNSTSLTNANLNLYTQPAEDRIASLLMHADGRWEYDDSNYTDLPIATTTVTSGQQDYSLPTTQLRVLRAEIKDSNGDWQKLETYDQQDEPFYALSEVDTESGLPDRYNVLGNSVILYPNPDYTQAASLKIYFQRGALKYDYTANTNAGQFTDGTGSGATTDAPGFNLMFHDLITDWASYNYAVANGLPSASGFAEQIGLKEDAIKKEYAKRNPDDRPIMRPKPVNYL